MEKYELDLAAAMIRGAFNSSKEKLLPRNLSDKRLEELSSDEICEILRIGQSAGLRLYHFKTKELLPRVKMVLGFLKGIQPNELLDVGSGRGVFLFPVLKEFPLLPVTSVDILPRRVEMLQYISSGGYENLTAIEKDICLWKDENLFDVVTMLEVLEHIPDVQTAVSNAVRLAKRFVIVSVPSKADDNPEHIHLLTKDRLTDLFRKAGCRKLHFSGVNGHLILLASVE